VKKASPGREKTYRIVDIREQGRIFGSIPRRALDYSRAFHPSDEASIDTLTGIWRSRKQRPSEPSTASSHGQAQPIDTIQSKLGMRFSREILKNKKPAQLIPGRLFSSNIIRR
jgi:hypothetical protein